MRWREVGGAAAGWLCVYVAVGGAAGYALATHVAPFRLFADGFHSPPYCLPERELFGAIGSRCDSGLFNIVWFVGVGLPRLVLAAAGWALILTSDGGRWGVWPGGGFWLALLDGFAVLPVGFYAAGVRYWWNRRRGVGLALGLLGVIELGAFIYGQYPG